MLPAALLLSAGGWLRFRAVWTGAPLGYALGSGSIRTPGAFLRCMPLIVSNRCCSVLQRRGREPRVVLRAVSLSLHLVLYLSVELAACFDGVDLVCLRLLHVVLLPLCDTLVLGCHRVPQRERKRHLPGKWYLKVAWREPYLRDIAGLCLGVLV
jgi:hypothetical protein